MAQMETPLRNGILNDKIDAVKATVDAIKLTVVDPVKTLSDTNDTVEAGFYEATTLSVVDADLATENIKAGVTIFGIEGKEEVVDTTEASNPATAEDIADGKVAFVNGQKITGTST